MSEEIEALVPHGRHRVTRYDVHYELIYGFRHAYLPLVRRYRWQVLVSYLGSMMWVNVDPVDVFLFSSVPSGDLRRFVMTLEPNAVRTVAA